MRSMGDKGNRSARLCDGVRNAVGRGGFTLIELLVTVALLVIVMGMLLYPMLSSIAYFRSATARADAQTAARNALDAMARELAEAMYVQLDMYDNSMLAFVPPLRQDPDDPNSEIVVPPRPDWSRAVRYWRALHDPTMNYNPGTQVGPANTYYLARTTVPEPFITSDPWNRWNDTWAARQSVAATQGVTNWSAIPRVVHADVDRYGTRWTPQPGYPYLAVQYRLAEGMIDEEMARREYRDRVVALTPNAVEYDVARLDFRPTVVSGELLRSVEGPDGADYSVYRARYPLWRLGARYTGWAVLVESPPIVFPDWARDPFLLVYRYDPIGVRRDLVAVGCFDPRSRTTKLLNPYAADPNDPSSVIYDTGDYPYLSDPAAAAVAFGVDWIDGSLHFDFPPPEGSNYIIWPSQLETPLSLWGSYNPGDVLGVHVIADSVTVRIDSDNDLRPDRALTRVACVPRENTDQFRLGVDPASSDPRYGWIRLPSTLSDGQDARRKLWIDYRWRKNSIWADGVEYPDLVSAYYRTAAVIDVGLTVVRWDPGARRADPRQTISQSAYMSRRVKLRNILREIRYGEE
jgi:prepilin-type N-terminal cleavage/methylation domain-containing protein